jgi:hypothetical protein
LKRSFLALALASASVGSTQQLTPAKQQHKSSESGGQRSSVVYAVSTKAKTQKKMAWERGRERAREGERR